MKKFILTQDIYDNYYNTSYILSLLCDKNILDKLKLDYASGFIKEDDLLNFLKSFVNEQQILFLADERIQNNLDLIIQNASLKNNDIKNDIKKSLNSTDYEVNCNYSFLRTQYIIRKYGCNNILKIKKNTEEFISLPEQFWTVNKEQLYNSIVFDFNLISALEKLDGYCGSIYDECLYNYQLFASINYFKFGYPYMLNDKTFLSFIKQVTKLQNMEKKDINNDNCLFADFYKINKKTLKYVNKELRHL